MKVNWEEKENRKLAVSYILETHAELYKNVSKIKLSVDEIINNKQISTTILATFGVNIDKIRSHLISELKQHFGECKKSKRPKRNFKKENKTASNFVGLHDEYKLRNQLLSEHGFKNYCAYLNSELWLSTRLVVLNRDNHICTRFRGYNKCSKTAKQVHHKSYNYDTLFGVDITDLVSVCVDCHHEMEYNDNGKKRTLFQANRIHGGLYY